MNYRQPEVTSSNIAKLFLATLEALKRNTVLIHDGIERELTIAVNNIILVICWWHLFEILNGNSSTTLTVNLEVYNGCWDALYSKRADLVYGAPHAVPSSEGIISEPVGQMEWDFVVSPLHPLAVKRHPVENVNCVIISGLYRDTSVNFPRCKLVVGRTKTHFCF